MTVFFMMKKNMMWKTLVHNLDERFIRRFLMIRISGWISCPCFKLFFIVVLFHRNRFLPESYLNVFCVSKKIKYIYLFFNPTRSVINFLFFYLALLEVKERHTDQIAYYFCKKQCLNKRTIKRSMFIFLILNTSLSYGYIFHLQICRWD